MPIHVLMKDRISTSNPIIFIQYTYCGDRLTKDMMYVMYDFYLPNKIMCNICVDEWENEDIRMKTPQKTEKLIGLNEKD